MQHSYGRKLGMLCAFFATTIMLFVLFPPVTVQANEVIYSLSNDSYVRGRNAGHTNLHGTPNLQRAGSSDANPRVYVNVSGSNRTLHVTSRTQAWHGVDILRAPLSLTAGTTIQVTGRVASGTVMELGGVNNAASNWPTLTTATANAQGNFTLNLTLTAAQISNNPDGFRIRTSTNATAAFHIDTIVVTRPSGGGNQPQPTPPPSGGNPAAPQALNFVHNWDSGNLTRPATGGTSTSSQGTATSSFNLGTGAFSASWSTTQAGNRFNNLHGMGWRVGVPNRRIGYNVGQLSHTSGHQGMTIAAFYGWTRGPLIEWYVIDNWLNHRSTPGTMIGTLQSDGGTYEVWRANQNGHHINGFGPFIQIKSVRTSVAPLGTNRTITFQNHVDAWARFGQPMGNEWYYQVFIIEGWESNGSGNATVWAQ